MRISLPPPPTSKNRPKSNHYGTITLFETMKCRRIRARKHALIHFWRFRFSFFLCAVKGPFWKRRWGGGLKCAFKHSFTSFCREKTTLNEGFRRRRAFSLIRRPAMRSGGLLIVLSPRQSRSGAEAFEINLGDSPTEGAGVTPFRPLAKIRFFELWMNALIKSTHFEAGFKFCSYLTKCWEWLNVYVAVIYSGKIYIVCYECWIYSIINLLTP